MPTFVTLGDSVTWGQGLLPDHKMHRLVAASLRQRHPDLVEHQLAHSGAIIGAGAAVTMDPVHGEVPVGHPTIIQQVHLFDGDPDDVVAILVNGGINDVDFRTILLPTTSMKALAALVFEHCFDSMKTLLREVVLRFRNPAAPIVVTAYFPILSNRSQPFGIPLMLAHLGLALPFDLGIPLGQNLVVERCLLFFRESTASLSRAVIEVNAELPAPRIVFADPHYTERNAAFADEPWLWGLDQTLLLPVDDVAGERRDACDLALDPLDLFARKACHRASAGHPNRTGALEYAAAIRAALGLP